MAIIKEMLLSTGFLGEYHKVNDVIGDVIYISLYKNKEAYLSGNPPYPKSLKYKVPKDYFLEETLKEQGNSYMTLAYKYLKTLDEYEGCVDDSD